MSKDRFVSTGSRIKEEDRINGKTRGMKDSGVEWIGEIPEDWEVRKYKNFAISGMGNTILKEELAEKGIPVYSATRDDVVFGYLEKPNLVLNKGDFVIPARGNSIGYMYMIREEKATCTQTTIYSRIKNINKRFLLYCGKGLRNYWFEFDNTAIPQITVNQVQNNIVPFPTFEEQQKIANFLDEKVSLIDYTIEKTKQSIEDCKKYKQALITETVTKGLNPDVEMKDSGVEWIGEVPEHWKRTRLKRVLLIPITDGPHETPKLLDGGFPFISAEAIKNNKINFNLRRGYISEEDHKIYSKKCKPQLNDILMVKSGATTGNVAIVETDEEFSIWSPLALIRCNDKSIYYKYLFYYLQSDIFQRQVQQFWNYGTQQNIGMNVLENLFVSFPDLREQKQIADYLDKKCSEIDKIISQKEQLIKELEDYKKSLIYEYVTGKKRVV